MMRTLRALTSDLLAGVLAGGAVDRDLLAAARSLPSFQRLPTSIEPRFFGQHIVKETLELLAGFSQADYAAVAERYERLQAEMAMRKWLDPFDGQLLEFGSLIALRAGDELLARERLASSAEHRWATYEAPWATTAHWLRSQNPRVSQVDPSDLLGTFVSVTSVEGGVAGIVQYHEEGLGFAHVKVVFQRVLDVWLRDTKDRWVEVSLGAPGVQFWQGEASFRRDHTTTRQGPSLDVIFVRLRSQTGGHLETSFTNELANRSAGFVGKYELEIPPSAALSLTLEVRWHEIGLRRKLLLVDDLAVPSRREEPTTGVHVAHAWVLQGSGDASRDDRDDAEVLEMYGRSVDDERSRAHAMVERPRRLLVHAFPTEHRSFNLSVAIWPREVLDLLQAFTGLN